ncbi:SDR family oxidoreductase [Cytophagaceae bacterium DM2B3-1]|uniref:SDR family oxidoreductase n=1 Tax=Xanthocytophaga flava TaxID=3048013 RepID=A0ABT7CNQ3_9BACT|nr:SDR family oxidoreductase [Xanthocytophaga flavus]MDJ1495312.1 SDR family oxidoreductase [Xanthocytophaga flavus]
MKLQKSSLLKLAIGAGILWAAKSWIRMRRSFDVEGKVIVITGGTRGLGLSIARELASQKAKLAICSRNIEQLKDAEEELKDYGIDVLALRCDITKQRDVEEMMEQVYDHFGQIDVLINNAGIIEVGALDNQAKSDYEEAIRTHLYASIYTVYSALPYMRQTGRGRIVNISSIGGKVGVPHLAPYSASKFALAGFSKTLRAELLREGIIVTTVYPGLMRTGSPRNVTVKGQHQKEYAWFKTSASLPLLTASAENAALQIVSALKTGRAELVITLPAKLISILDELFPELSADFFALMNRFLPAASPEGQHSLGRKGYESESADSQTVLSRSSGQAAVQNNEL